MSEIYLILNETTFHGTDQVTSEIVPPAHDSLQGAMDALNDIATDLDVEVEEDANSVTVNGAYGTGIDTDEYYIIEVELKSRG